MRARRAAEGACVAIVLLLAAAAFFMARHVAVGGGRYGPRRLWAGLAARLPVPGPLRVGATVVMGAPPALEPLLIAAVGAAPAGGWGAMEPRRIARRLKEGFPCVREVRVRRDWLRRAATFEIVLQRPLGRVVFRGRTLWLTAAGTPFEVPDGVFPLEEFPVVDPGPGTLVPEDWTAVAQFMTAVSKEGALPSRLERLSYRSDDEGWEAGLADGTRLLWGRLSWTEAKLGRLREVLGAAGAKRGGGVTADLRYFEDGKILVRPTPASAVRMPHRPRERSMAGASAGGIQI